MPGQVVGKVVAVSETGDLITDITADQLRGALQSHSVRIWCDPHETVGIFGEDHQQPQSTFVAVLTQRGRMELRVVGLSAQEILGVTVGHSVMVEW